MQGGVGDINIEGRGGVILDKNINYRKMWRLRLQRKGATLTYSQQMIFFTKNRSEVRTNSMYQLLTTTIIFFLTIEII